MGNIVRNIFCCDSQFNSLQEIGFLNEFLVVGIILTHVARSDSYCHNL
jgi:hypothetical protein